MADVEHPIFTAAVFIWLILFTDPAAAETVDTGPGENRLVVCIASPVLSLDPTDYRDRTTQMVLKTIFDSLTTRDAQMRVVPQLAESWRILDDTTWEFKLKRGVRFHNGDAFTAEDVRFTLDRVIRDGALDGATSPRKGLLKPLAGIRIIDRYTVRMMTDKPWPILPLMLTLQEMIPSHYIRTQGAGEFRKKPVGAGPYRFVRSIGDKCWILERYAAYYGGSLHNPPVGTASLESLVFETVPLPAARVARLKQGKCDIISNISPAALPILKAVPDIAVLPTRPTRSYFAEINCQSPPFDDARLRIALNLAVDRTVIVDSLLYGHGIILPTVLLPDAFAYHPSLSPYAYDPETAKKLIAETAYPLDRVVSIHCHEDNLNFASLIAAFLTRVGLKTAIHKLDKDKPATGGKDAAWDIFVSSWGNATLDPVGILVPKFKSSGSGNYSGYSNETVDQLIDRAETVLDRKCREAGYRRVQEIVYRDAPMIFGYAAEEFYAFRTRVKNFMPPVSGMLNLHDVYLENGDRL